MNNLTNESGGRDESIHSILPLLLVLARRLRFLAGVPVSCGILAVIYSLVSDPIYTATSRILPPQYNENTVMSMQNDMGGDSQLGNASLTLQNPTDLFVGILTSRTIMDGVIESNDLLTYYEKDSLAEARLTLAAAIEIRASKDGIVSVSVEDTDREHAAVLANAFVNEFYRFSQTLARSQSERRGMFYGRALDNARNELAIAEANLLRIEKQTGYTQLGGQDQVILFAAAELQGQISAREIQLKTMASYATSSNPDVQLINQELTNLRDELEKLTDNPVLQPTATEVTSLPTMGIGQAPDAMLAHAQARREVAYWENIMMLIGRYSELGTIDESRDMSLFQVLDWAVPPHDKSKPRTKVNAILAVIGSGFVCLLWVLASAYVSQRRENSQQFNQQWVELTENLINIMRNPFNMRTGA